MELVIKTVKLTLSGASSYRIAGHNSDYLAMLAAFLTAISPGLTYQYFHDWLTGKINQSSAYSNSNGLEEENGRIFVCLDFQSEEENRAYFNTTKENMLTLIDRWIDLACTIYTDENGHIIKLAKEIIITQDDDGHVSIVRSDGFDPKR